ncbi:MAG: Glutamate-1-semialdehyde aminotransferase HemL [Candidatus Methanohalarchaeum thermophilum]|uniref:Glutamate-1-semialdehyde 2,1-aminomutase n=1 Tax=Methanohalarchaeum thermophilum TaxID=1903181 RepID=A0A1Q6DXN5_METT1|nr:MAG: Glutamate-1-semialdehyde aminotransferase HemL [Candidatus Methanohalarchaeum thermophilum]
MSEFNESKELFKEAKRYLAGGVNSPARAYDPFPIFMEKAEGTKIYSTKGKKFIDYSLAFGPQIVGHKHPKVKEKVLDQIEKGWAFGTSTELETKVAKKIVNRYNSIDKIRTVNTGTEATMTAIRLARGYTGRDKIVKFEGGYHGSHDSVLVKAGSGASTHGAPDSPGVPKDLAKETIVAPWNNKEKIKEIFKKEGDNIAAIIAEPIFGNAGCIPPSDGFLDLLRDLTKENDSLLILDEVITGFRVSKSGAQGYFDIDPDITTLGKIAGGGFPIGILGGHEEVMSEVSPEGDVYQAGTFSGNPVTMAGSLATLEVLEEENVIEEANENGEKIRAKLRQELNEYPTLVQGISSMFSFFLTNQETVRSYNDVQECDFDLYEKFHRELAKKGTYFPPSQYEISFVSHKHTEEEIDQTVDSIKKVLEKIT